jgi:transcription antitermination protein NusB
MLNRRHLRIKAFQTAYAFQQVEKPDRKQFEQILLDSIHSVHKSYAQLLQLLLELKDFESRDVEDRSAKYLPSSDDLNAKPILEKNSFIQLLNLDKNLTYLLKTYKVSWQGEDMLLRELYNKIKLDEQYIVYGEKENPSLVEDREIITHLFKTILFQDPLLEQYLEENYINWPVDKQSVDGMLLKTVRAYKEGASEALDILPITANWEEDKEFVVELFNKTILNNTETEKYISDKTQNWDVERIAMVDTILMKMALTELMNFNSIPVKVTMNEYIDISKEFSTPKSKGFINGILDKILIDLKKEGKINKIGRGLLE